LSKRFISQHQTKLFFFVIWLHISILNFLYVSYRGPVFLVKESMQLNTLLTHVVIAILTLGFYYFVTKVLAHKHNKQSCDSVGEIKVLDKQCE